MFREYKTRNQWTGEEVEVRYRSTVSAVATRHADAVDFGFSVDGRRVWVALPLSVWDEFARLTGRVLDDRTAQNAAGRYLRHLLQTGEETGRALYTASRDEALSQLEAILVPGFAREAAKEAAREALRAAANTAITAGAAESVHGAQ